MPVLVERQQSASFYFQVFFREYFQTAAFPFSDLEIPWVEEIAFSCWPSVLAICMTKIVLILVNEFNKPFVVQFNEGEEFLQIMFFKFSQTIPFWRTKENIIFMPVPWRSGNKISKIMEFMETNTFSSFGKLFKSQFLSEIRKVFYNYLEAFWKWRLLSSKKSNWSWRYKFLDVGTWVSRYHLLDQGKYRHLNSGLEALWIENSSFPLQAQQNAQLYSTAQPLWIQENSISFPPDFHPQSFRGRKGIRVYPFPEKEKFGRTEIWDPVASLKGESCKREPIASSLSHWAPKNLRENRGSPQNLKYSAKYLKYLCLPSPSASNVAYGYEKLLYDASKLFPTLQLLWELGILINVFLFFGCDYFSYYTFFIYLFLKTSPLLSWFWQILFFKEFFHGVGIGGSLWSIYEGTQAFRVASYDRQAAYFFCIFW